MFCHFIVPLKKFQVFCKSDQSEDFKSRIKYLVQRSHTEYVLLHILSVTAKHLKKVMVRPAKRQRVPRVSGSRQAVTGNWTCQHLTLEPSRVRLALWGSLRCYEALPEISLSIMRLENVKLIQSSLMAMSLRWRLAHKREYRVMLLIHKHSGQHWWILDYWHAYE